MGSGDADTVDIDILLTPQHTTAHHSTAHNGAAGAASCNANANGNVKCGCKCECASAFSEVSHNATDVLYCT